MPLPSLWNWRSTPRGKQPLEKRRRGIFSQDVRLASFQKYKREDPLRNGSGLDSWQGLASARIQITSCLLEKEYDTCQWRAW